MKTIQIILLSIATFAGVISSIFLNLFLGGFIFIFLTSIFLIVDNREKNNSIGFILLVIVISSFSIINTTTEYKSNRIVEEVFSVYEVVKTPIGITYLTEKDNFFSDKTKDSEFYKKENSNLYKYTYIKNRTFAYITIYETLIIENMDTGEKCQIKRHYED
jgi:hypothetical protein